MPEQGQKPTRTRGDSFLRAGTVRPAALAALRSGFTWGRPSRHAEALLAPLVAWRIELAPHIALGVITRHGLALCSACGEPVMTPSTSGNPKPVSCRVCGAARSVQPPRLPKVPKRRKVRVEPVPLSDPDLLKGPT